MFPVLDFIPAREIDRLRRHPSPTVAWHALDSDDVSFPFSVVVLMVVFVLLVQFSRSTLFALSPRAIPTSLAQRFNLLQRLRTKTQHAHATSSAPPAVPTTPRSLTPAPTLPSIPSLPAWIADWFRDPLGNSTHATHFAQLNDRYRISVEKFVKISHRYKSLQAQLKVGPGNSNYSSLPSPDSTMRNILGTRRTTAQAGRGPACYDGAARGCAAGGGPGARGQPGAVRRARASARRAGVARATVARPVLRARARAARPRARAGGPRARHRAARGGQGGFPGKQFILMSPSERC